MSLTGSSIQHLKDGADVLTMADDLLIHFTKVQMRTLLDRALHLYANFDDVGNGVVVCKLHTRKYDEYCTVVGLCSNLSSNGMLGCDELGYTLCEVVTHNWKYMRKGTLMFPIDSSLEGDNLYRGDQGVMRKMLLEYYIDVLTYTLSR